MERENIGELEELVMLIAGWLHPEAYAVSIRKELLSKMDRKVVLSSVHTVLNRLEKKGYLSSTFGESTPERGGKRKRCFTITQAGYEALKSVHARREQLYANFLNTNFNFN